MLQKGSPIIRVETLPLVALAVVASAGFSPDPALAADTGAGTQSRAPSPAQVMPTKPKLPFVRNKDEFKRQALTQAPDLPDLPPYPGQTKLILAKEFPGVHAGKAYMLFYSCKDDPEQIKQWYQQTLAANKWTVANVNSKGSITATKSGNCASVTLGPPNLPGAKCNMTIMYRQVRHTQ